MTGHAIARAVRPGGQITQGLKVAQSVEAAKGREVSQGRLRITRRGYAVLTFLVALPLVIVAFVLVTNGGGAAATATASHASFGYVTVQAGDTLWQLAGQIAPSADPRDVISDIVHLNQLSTSDVHPGQHLAIPSQYSH
jgi:LysM repeat protein